MTEGCKPLGVSGAVSEVCRGALMKGIIDPNRVSEGDPNNYMIAFRRQAQIPVFHLSIQNLLYYQFATSYK